MRVDAGTYVNDFASFSTSITIEGVGGMAHLQATQPPPDGKAIFTISNANVTINHLEFSGAAVADQNGAGIRYQGGNLVVRNSYFHDNQDGILAANDLAGTIQIISSEFARNGAGDGRSHGIYVNALAALKIEGSYFHDTYVGHHIKSRATSTIIENSRIVDGNSTASYSIDLPNGGVGQGPNSPNSAIIHYGGEATPAAGSSLLIANNVIENFRSTGIGVLNQTAIAVDFDYNQLYNVTQLASGPIDAVGTTFLASPVVLDTSSPYLTAAPPPPPPPRPVNAEPRPCPPNWTPVQYKR